MNTNCIKKIFYTTLFIFTILSVFTIPTINHQNVLRTNMILEDNYNPNTNTVYLLDKNNYLTEVNIFLEKDSIIETSKRIFEYLKENNQKINYHWKGYIPENGTIKEIEWKNGIIYLNLSKECIKKNKDIVLQGLIHSLLKVEEINKISLQIEEEFLKEYKDLLGKDFPINPISTFTNRNQIEKVTIYYHNIVDKEPYLVPVTKYQNKTQSKVETIIEELRDNIPTHLTSSLSPNTQLLDYEEINDMMILNFNQNEQEPRQLIAYSIFENYEVSAVMFKENNEIKEIITRNNNHSK